MSDHVWLSTALTQSVHPISFETDIAQIDLEGAMEAETLNKKGKPVSEEICPKRVWAGVRLNQETGENFPSRTTVPDIFMAKGQLIVSSPVATIMGQFNLGAGALYPVSEGVFQNDNQTRIEGDYFTWIFGNTKTAFLEQHSPNVEAMGLSGRSWCSIDSSQADDDIAVSKAALSGPDVWVDPVLFKSIFLSGPLGDALVEAGLKQALYLLRCRVI